MQSLAMKLHKSPTEQSYEELQFAYDWFNERLFESSLPPCLITFQRNKSSMGYFSSERFVNHSGKRTDEIALNPEYFAVISIEELLSTLVHEQAHLWQRHFGTPGRGKYHNQEWANKMLSIGLCPSDTGQPGGKQTGDHMSDYIVVNGRFSEQCSALLATNFRVSWYDRYPAFAPTATAPMSTLGSQTGSQSGKITETSLPAAQSLAPAKANPNLKDELVRPSLGVTVNSSNRLKYTCSGCQVQAWGKPRLHLICGECNLVMQPP
jgi:predicted SprT family Zn-dependent metalloprotease